MAKYHSIRDEVLDLIAELDAGDALPAERALAPRLGVSRMTLRRAVEELIREGRLVRRQGAGTFVAGPKIAQGLAITSFSDDMRQRGSRPSSRTLAVDDDVMANVTLSRRLEIAPGEKAMRVVRLRLADDVPMAVETLHVPRGVTPGLDPRTLTDGSFYDVLGDTYGIRLSGAVRTIEATVTDEAESRMLGVPARSPAFLFEQITRDTGGRVVEFVRSVYRGDRYQLRVDLHPADLPPRPTSR